MEIQAADTGYNKFQGVKRRFFALRNGVISNALRSSGSPFKIIFGLTYPQLQEIALWSGPDKELSEQLRADSSTRECHLLAPLIYPIDSLTKEIAEEWLSSENNPEVIDIFCHSLLRKVFFAPQMAIELLEAPYTSDITLYKALRLCLNCFSSIDRVRFSTALKRIRGNALESTLNTQLFNQLNELLES